MYQVIARKYRPQTFRDVVNQAHVKTTLENAIAQKRIAHGYIFSGQRGTGKTTVARILARCLNCIEGPTGAPCGVCASCREISSGGSVDVIEIDAASNRGINEMRELRENVRYQPARDRYKVFIIDEAHQITSEAFNALLKTIEEPPPWVVFVLCTTEAHKIPATIASRCQHFSFRSVDFEDLVARLQWICGQEGIEADAEALAVLAQAGEGSVRDSLSALDQAIACCGSKLDAAEVRALLGAFSLELLERVTQALLEGDSGRMLAIVDELERNGHNLQHFCREIARYFRNLLVARIAGPETRLIAASAAQRNKLAEIAAAFSEEDLTRYLNLTLELFRDLQFSLQPRFHLEIGLVRLVQAGRLLPIEQALATLEDGAAVSRSAQPAPERAPAQGPVQSPIQSKAAPQAPARTGPSPFELDRAKKAGRQPEPQSAGGRPERAGIPSEERPQPDAGPLGLRPGRAGTPPEGPQPDRPTSGVRELLHARLSERGLTHLADAVENSLVTESGGELRFLAPPSYVLYLRDNAIAEAVREIFGKPMQIRVAADETGRQSAPDSLSHENADETARRALAHEEVRRFREVFGGEVRKIRNLKE
jgi:DNA polymerase III subunit gamma/tau